MFECSHCKKIINRRGYCTQCNYKYKQIWYERRRNKKVGIKPKEFTSKKSVKESTLVTPETKAKLAKILGAFIERGLLNV